MEENKKNLTGIKSKSEILQLYGFSQSTLKRLLNVQYFDQLAEIGYRKTAQILSPKQFELFMKLYGEP